LLNTSAKLQKSTEKSKYFDFSVLFLRIELLIQVFILPQVVLELHKFSFLLNLFLSDYCLHHK